MAVFFVLGRGSVLGAFGPAGFGPVGAAWLGSAGARGQGGAVIAPGFWLSGLWIPRNTMKGGPGEGYKG